MAITDKEQGVWNLEEVYNKQTEGGIWSYNAQDPFRLFAWGQNAYGSLGTNDRTQRSSPIQIGTDINWDKDSIVRGTYSMTAKKTDGTLWMWGDNQVGELGFNDRTSRSSPVQLPGTTWSFGSGSGKATKTDGTMWVWGGEYWGTLGLNQDIAGPGSNFPGYSSPVQLPGTWATGRRKHGSGGNDTVTAIKADGNIWMWGHGG